MQNLTKSLTGKSIAGKSFTGNPIPKLIVCLCAVLFMASCNSSNSTGTSPPATPTDTNMVTDMDNTGGGPTFTAPASVFGAVFTFSGITAGNFRQRSNNGVTNLMVITLPASPALTWSGRAGSTDITGTYTYDAADTFMFMHAGGSIVSEVVLTYTSTMGGTIDVTDNMTTPTDQMGNFTVTGATATQVTAVNSQVSTFGN